MDLFHYITPAGSNVFREWLRGLNDPDARARVTLRVSRLAAGNFGDCKPLRDGVWELRIDYGPGYRVYYAKIGSQALLIFGGGDKRYQSRDIDRAVAFFKDYKKRTESP
jgi:putative addiction module killer protein